MDKNATIIGPNVSRLSCNIVYCVTVKICLFIIVQVQCYSFTYLNKAINKLSNKILTKSIWNANIT